ncbi:TonB-linked SusC/RagA family outer membrane protein [Catalinimonas alkaloidigena]|uniref:SusC/RagA family TonB-linked outer membrane protein n=1 Tax=Catalinimonas alkaloidigena TaxID=1075417 RepID=UPI0024066B8E|nr:SusC/RagA family TonB-linked outer membrane protein [Catalinimonas alkaloidigena]MDF9801142.1 TonB-linked SusC/RagA family outer membrane protein [Catalinimonas alkaloidigena]
MKKQLLILTLMVASVTYAMAQRQVSGTVTGTDDSDPLPGVNVLVKGTTTGTVTDIDGNYNISVPGDDAILTFSSIGYALQEVEVGSRSTINVSLAPDVQELSEVVVTALGMERSAKALSYSVGQVDGESFQEARELNIANSLAGKVAGVNVSNIASGPAGSSRVVIRGNVSLTGNNQPLYVVDGIPIDNSGFGQAGMWGGSDEGDGTSSINPDDIAEMTVLKGANAAALYGSRASNGVILITTKSGKARKGIGIDFNSNFVFEDIFNLLDLQKEYGQGNQGRAPVDASEAFNVGTSVWGGRLDGRPVAQFDGVERPYAYAGDNYDRFYRTGTTWTNSIGFSGGNETQTFRLNFSNLQNKSIIPNSGYDRNNLSLSYNGNYADKLTVTSKVMYSNENAQNRPRISDSPGNAPQGLLRLPPNYNVNDLKGDPDKLGAVPEGFVPGDGKAPGEELQISNDLWNQNPWWAAHQFENDDVRDRIITSNVARYDITDFLYVQGRFGMDWYTRRETDITPYGTGYQRRGSMNEREERIRETNLEGMIGFDDNFGDISVNAFIGGNRMRRSYEALALNGSNFNIPFFNTFTNLENQNPGYGFSEKGINSVFGSATIGYKDLIYITGTARQDWFSTLNPETNDILYPSIGGSFVFTELFNMSSNSFLSYGKLRSSWAQVGGDTDPYRLDLTYSLGQGHLGLPTASISQSNIPNRFLVPLTSTEFEIGADFRFFNNRLGVDFTYYRQETTDDILNATISEASGFSGTTINVGKMQNRGVELLLTGTPIQQSDFNWDVTFNFSLNNNEVIELSDGITSIQVGEPRTRVAFINQIVGEQFSTITGFTQKMINGQPVFDPDSGQPVRSDETSILGNGVHNYVGGLTNSFNWKGIYMDFLIDFKAGGDIYSGTNARFVGAGQHKMTVEPTSGLGFVSEGRESLTVTGVDQDGEAFSKTLDATEIPGFWGAYSSLSDRFIYDASFIKFRQLSLGYTLPSSLLKNTPINRASISFVGRNLFILYSNLENVDPESNYSNDNAQGFDYFGVPQTRSYGFNLKVSF